MIKHIFAFAVVLVSALPSWSQKKDRADMQVQLYLINPEVRFERSEEQVWNQVLPSNYAVALKHKKISALLEMSYWQTTTGNAALSVTKQQQEYLLWGRFHYWEQDVVSLFAGAAAGTYRQSFETHLIGDISKDSGAYSLEGGMSLGLDGRWRFISAAALVAAAEIRFLFGSDFDPNPQLSGILRVGLEF